MRQGRPGLVVSLPVSATALLARSPAGRSFVGAEEVKTITMASSRLPLCSREGVEVGVAVIERRVLGYLDLAPGRGSLRAIVVPSARGAEAFAVFGAEIQFIGEVGLDEAERPSHAGESLPTVSLTELAHRFETAADVESAQSQKEPA